MTPSYSTGPYGPRHAPTLVKPRARRRPVGAPQIRQHRLRCREPVDPAGGNGAVGGSDVLRDRHVNVVAGERIREPERTPHLGEPGIRVQEYAQRRGREDLLVVEEAHDVQQERRLSHPLDEPGSIDPEYPAVIPVQQRPGIREIELAHDRVQVAEVHRMLHVAEVALPVEAHAGLDAIDERHLPPEALEAPQVLEELPGVAGLVRLLGERPRNCYAAAQRSAPDDLRRVTPLWYTREVKPAGSR